MQKGTFVTGWVDSNGRVNSFEEIDNRYLKNIIRKLLKDLDAVNVNVPEGVDLGNLFKQEQLDIKRNLGIALSEAKNRGLLGSD